MKINNITGIMETFAALPSLEKVHITEDGRHFFNEEHAKSANGYDEEKKDKKITYKAKKSPYKTFARDAKELTDAAKAAADKA